MLAHQSRLQSAKPFAYNPATDPTIDLWYDVNNAASLVFSTTSPAVASGTAPPTVTLSGSATSGGPLRIECITPGAIGVATIRWTMNGGASWTTQTTATSLPLTGSGLTATWLSGTFSGDNVYTAHVKVTQVNDIVGRSMASVLDPSDITKATWGKANIAAFTATSITATTDAGLATHAISGTTPGQLANFPATLSAEVSAGTTPWNGISRRCEARR